MVTYNNNKEISFGKCIPNISFEIKVKEKMVRARLASIESKEKGK